MLKVRDLNVSYGKTHVLRNISLDVGEGELVTLLGSNGAGKTTLLMSISGLITLVSGSVEFHGTEISKLTSHKIVGLGIVQVSQGGHLFPEMTVFENLELGGYQSTHSSINGRMEKVYGYFEPLRRLKRRKAGTLSGGERQMVAIGRALMSNPRLLLLDEPSVGLSPLMVENLANILLKVHREELTMILAEQNVYLGLDMADRGYVLQNGSVAASGKTSELFESELIKKAYLGM